MRIDQRRLKGRRTGVCILGPTPSGRALLENFKANGREVLCFVDPMGKFSGESWAGVPVVRLDGQNDIMELRGIGVREFIIVSGATAPRKRLFTACTQAGLAPLTLIHPTATVLQGTTIGQGCIIAARAVVGVGTVMEDNSQLGLGAIADHDCHIGHHATVGAGCVLGANTRLEECAFLGDGAVTLAARNIAARAIVVSGALVTQNVVADTVAAGIPARAIPRRRTL